VLEHSDSDISVNQTDLREICCEDGRWMELVQDHGQRRVTAFNFRVVLLGLLFLYLLQNKQSGHPKELQKSTAAPEVIPFLMLLRYFQATAEKTLLIIQSLSDYLM
jgi:hypothetical protein